MTVWYVQFQSKEEDHTEQYILRTDYGANIQWKAQHMNDMTDKLMEARGNT